MYIEYLGHSAFLLSYKNGIRIVTDPYTRVGYEMPKGITADIVTVSHHHFDHDYIAGVDGEKTVISTTESYTFGDVQIKGIESYHDDKKGEKRGANVAYILKGDKITLCHLGDLGEPLNPELVKAIGKVDILCIPVGGNYTIDAKQAKAYIDAVCPSAVIPMHYKPIEGGIDIAPLGEFVTLFTGDNGWQITPKMQGIRIENVREIEGKIVLLERRRK